MIGRNLGHLAVMASELPNKLVIAGDGATTHAQVPALRTRPLLSIDEVVHLASTPRHAALRIELVLASTRSPPVPSPRTKRTREADRARARSLRPRPSCGSAGCSRRAAWRLDGVWPHV